MTTSNLTLSQPMQYIVNTITQSPVTGTTANVLLTEANALGLFNAQAQPPRSLTWELQQALSSYNAAPTNLPNLSATGPSPMMRPYGWVEIYGPIGFEIPPAIYSPLMSAANSLPVAGLLPSYGAPVAINNPLYDPYPIYINGIGSPISTAGTPLSPQNLQSSVAAPLINTGQQALLGIQSGDPFYQPTLHDLVANIPVANQYNPFTTSPPVMYFATTGMQSQPVAMLNHLISQISGGGLATPQQAAFSLIQATPGISSIYNLVTPTANPY